MASPASWQLIHSWLAANNATNVQTLMNALLAPTGPLGEKDWARRLHEGFTGPHIQDKINSPPSRFPAPYREVATGACADGIPIKHGTVHPNPRSLFAVRITTDNLNYRIADGCNALLHLLRGALGTTSDWATRALHFAWRHLVKIIYGNKWVPTVVNSVAVQIRTGNPPFQPSTSTLVHLSGCSTPGGWDLDPNIPEHLRSRDHIWKWTLQEHQQDEIRRLLNDASRDSGDELLRIEAWGRARGTLQGVDTYTGGNPVTIGNCAETSFIIWIAVISHSRLLRKNYQDLTFRLTTFFGFKSTFKSLVNELSTQVRQGMPANQLEQRMQAIFRDARALQLCVHPCWRCKLCFTVEDTVCPPWILHLDYLYSDGTWQLFAKWNWSEVMNECKDRASTIHDRVAAIVGQGNPGARSRLRVHGNV